MVTVEHIIEHPHKMPSLLFGSGETGRGTTHHAGVVLARPPGGRSGPFVGAEPAIRCEGGWGVREIRTRECRDAGNKDLQGGACRRAYGQTDGNPMIEPVRLPALRVHDGRARSVQRSDAMVNGRFDEKGPLIGDVARHVDGGAVSLGFQVLSVL